MSNVNLPILVTGATGFLGSHVAEQLSQAGKKVRALVRKTSNTQFLRTLENVELVEGAIDDKDSVTRAMQGVGAIVHAAGLVKARGPGEFKQVNVGGTENMLEAALEHRDTITRFVLVSSLAAGSPSDEHGAPVSVDVEPRPVTHYGRSKLAAENAALSHKDRLPITILRPPAIYGPRDREILIFFRSIHKGVLPLTNPVHAKLSMIYGADCARACIRAIEADVPSGSVFYIDDGQPHTFAELIQFTESALGRRAWVRFPLPKPVVRTAALASELYGKLTNRPVMLTRDKCNELFEQWVCDGSEARRKLGWEPEVAFEEGVQRTADWYKSAGWL